MEGRKTVKARIHLGDGKVHEAVMLVPDNLDDAQTRAYILNQYAMVRQHMEDTADEEPLPLEPLVRELFPERFPPGSPLVIDPGPLVSLEPGETVIDVDYPSREN